MRHQRDLLITGGPIWSGRADLPWAEALAVSNGRVAALGSLAQVEGQLGRPHETLDLHGKAVLPGFQDAHCHPVSGGLQRRSCDLEGRLTPADCQAAVLAYLDAHPQAEWIVGGGWSMESFPLGTPPLDLLDAVTGDRPAFLTNRDGHSAWINSAALKRAQIHQRTADPPHGRIERDLAGDPQGTLHEAAMKLVERLIPKPGAEEVTAALVDAQHHLHQLGIVGWQDAMVDPTVERAYSSAVAGGHLTARVRLALWWERDGGLDQIEGLLQRRTALRQEGLDGSSVKIMLDGVMETFTASLLHPYRDPGGSQSSSGRGGHLFLEPEQARQAVMELDRLDFQVHFHAIGDRAVRVALDSVQAAREARTRGGGESPRHHIAHLQLIDRHDLGRFPRLGVVANMQPFWACHEPQMDQLTIPFLGVERAARQYPFLSLLNRGTILAGGSDWPVSTANPLEEIAVAVTRITPESSRQGQPAYPPFLPEQRIPLVDALGAFTAGSAYVNQVEDASGTLAPGKWADLVVLAQDPFQIDPDHLPEARVELTMVAGQVVFDRGTA
ncbi:MAG: amidohydrolase [Candidatus Dormibacteria bacterium]